jgi:hypothetical protein
VVGPLFAPAAGAIIIRHDVEDAAYVVDDESFPALVDLISPGDCIGTLVHPSYLLTVAHCAIDLSVGGTLEVAGAAHPVAEVILHPSWEDLDEFDIALVRLTTPVTTVEPLPVYRGDGELGAVVTLVGRGVTATGLAGEEGGDSDGQLRRATNVVTDVSTHHLELRFDSDGQPGLTALEGVGAAGDSGCPAFIDVDGTRYIAGLNSFGDGSGAADVGQYGALDYQTRVSQYLPWIEEHVELPAVDLPSDDEPALGDEGEDKPADAVDVDVDDEADEGNAPIAEPGETSPGPDEGTESLGSDVGSGAAGGRSAPAGIGCGANAQVVTRTPPQAGFWLGLLVAALARRRRPASARAAP